MDKYSLASNCGHIERKREKTHWSDSEPRVNLTNSFQEKSTEEEKTQGAPFKVH